MFFTRLLGACRAVGQRLPSQCAICHHWPARPVCTQCAARFAGAACRCRGCAIRMPGNQQLCGQCLRQPTGLDLCLAAVDYAWPWADLVTQLKFQAQPGLATALADIMRNATDTAQLLSDCDALLPIPLAPGRLQERGYNQALLLARQLHPTRVRGHWLVRTHDTAAQSRLGRQGRWHNLHGAFAVLDAARPALQGRHVVLIDDVMTTGATLRAAAHALRSAGAGRISALTFARTPEHP